MTNLKYILVFLVTAILAWTYQSTPPAGVGSTYRPAPRNGQCPLCLTQHDIPKYDKVCTASEPAKASPDSSAYGLAQCTHWTPMGPPTTLQRCKRCNLAFFIDNN